MMEEVAKKLKIKYSQIKMSSLPLKLASFNIIPNNTTFNEGCKPAKNVSKKTEGQN